MKTRMLKFMFVAFALSLSLGVVSCKDDDNDEPQTMTLSTLKAGDIDLNGATAPNNVPISPVFTATFSSDVDAATATSSNITLLREYDDVAIPLTVAASGKTITITPTEGLASGTLHELTISPSVKSTGGVAITSIERTFTTAGFFAPSGMIAYWNFEDNADDQVGAFNSSSAIAVTYVAGRKTDAGKAVDFNGTTSLIEIPNGDDLMNTHDFTLSFWVKTNSVDKTNNHFVMGLAGWWGFQFEIMGDYKGLKLAAQYDQGDGTSNSDDLYYNGTGDLGWQGWTYSRDLTASGGVEFLIKDKWAHIVCVFNGTTKVGAMYINGEVMKTQDFNLWPEGDKKRGIVGLKYAGSPTGNNLAFGFIQGKDNRFITDAWADYADPANNHFKGQLDDVRIFHKVITEEEITLMYNSEKP